MNILNQSSVFVDFHKLFIEHPDVFNIKIKCKIFKQEMSTALNRNKENVLHLACLFNDAKSGKMLLDAGCSSVQQDVQGRTPLHVALQRKHKRCINMYIHEFQAAIIDHEINSEEKRDLFMNEFRLVLNISEEETLFQKQQVEDLKRLFSLYDHNGYTVLHLAVIYGLEDMVKVMLDFANIMGVAVLDHEVMDNGDTVLHLALRYKLRKMAHIIADRIKESVDYPNYSGATPREEFKFICMTK